jgi:probable rRNA maturation factor
MIRFDLSGRRLPAALSEADLKKTDRVVSKLLRIKKTVEIDLSFVSEKEIMRLNHIWLGKLRPTDVLSFPAADAHVFREPFPMRYIGDIIICPTFATREARRRSISPKEELVRLLVHGILHLKGYDHVTEEEGMRMFRLQERALESITA